MKLIKLPKDLRIPRQEFHRLALSKKLHGSPLKFLPPHCPAPRNFATSGIFSHDFYQEVFRSLPVNIIINQLKNFGRLPSRHSAPMTAISSPTESLVKSGPSATDFNSANNIQERTIKLSQKSVDDPFHFHPRPLWKYLWKPFNQ